MMQQGVCQHTAGSSGSHQLCVSIVPIFNHLQEDEMAGVAKTVRPILLKKGELLHSAGEDSDSLYILHTGKVKVYRLSESGKEQLIRILQPGDFTGELALFNESIHDDYAEALEKTEICSIQRTDLQAMLQRHPNISLKILSEFSSRLGQAESQMTSFATEDVETRIALYLAQQVEENKSTVYRLPMSKKDLASFLGTTPETISRKLAKFEDEGWIRQKDQRRIHVVDLDALLLV